MKIKLNGNSSEHTYEHFFSQVSGVKCSQNFKMLLIEQLNYVSLLVKNFTDYIQHYFITVMFASLKHRIRRLKNGYSFFFGNSGTENQLPFSHFFSKSDKVHIPKRNMRVCIRTTKNRIPLIRLYIYIFVKNTRIKTFRILYFFFEENYQRVSSWFRNLGWFPLIHFLRERYIYIRDRIRWATLEYSIPLDYYFDYKNFNKIHVYFYISSEFILNHILCVIKQNFKNLYRF